MLRRGDPLSASHSKAGIEQIFAQLRLILRQILL
jgi:hypothetical protein